MDILKLERRAHNSWDILENETNLQDNCQLATGGSGPATLGLDDEQIFCLEGEKKEVWWVQETNLDEDKETFHWLLIAPPASPSSFLGSYVCVLTKS